MPRLTPITKREQVSGDALTAFDAIIESKLKPRWNLHLWDDED